MRNSKGFGMPCISASAVLVALGAAHVQAADETGKWYINPQYGYTLLDESRSVDDGDHFAVGFGRHLTDFWSVELNALWGEFESDTARTLDQTVYSMDALAVFNRARSVSPYLTFGAGYIENAYTTDFDEYGPFLQAGVGLMFDVAENSAQTFVFQLRPEVKFRYDWADGADPNHGDYVFNLGFAFTFGPSNAPPPPVVQAAPPPPPPPPPSPPPPADSDGDGVLDTSDRCPGTPRGVAVDASGCPRGGPVVLKGVEFATNSATLAETSLSVLDDVATDLKAHPRLKVELQGHTDSSGADAYNLDLSQRRADSVRNYLIAQGVSGTQLVSRGYGESQPIADNGTSMGRAENRRVVMHVLENPGQADVQGGGN